MMGRSTTTRQLARTLFQHTSQSSAAQTQCAALRLTKPFSNSTARRADGDEVKQRENLLQNISPGLTRPKPSGLNSARPAGPPPRKHSLWDLTRTLTKTPAQTATDRAMARPGGERPVNTAVLDEQYGLDLENRLASEKASADPEPYHFHIYSHKHNTHVTVTKPNREPIVSLSCGNLGFRKSNRKHYDAAYQLGAYTIDKLQQQGWHNKIGKMEVSLRGFGPGREAVTKVLMGTEGTLLREKVCKVSDSTRLKFGGTRSKAPRRI